MLTIAVDNAALAKSVDFYGATEAQINVARLRALRKTQQHIETSVKRQASKDLRIPQRAIGDRFFSNRLAPGDDEMVVWIGTWAVSPFSIGTPNQTPMGVKVGRRSYPGAFLGEIFTSQQKVWIRLRSKHYSAELYPTKYRAGDRGMGRDKSGRFPVVRAAVPIDEVIAKVLTKESESFARQFETIFARELNYEINVKGQR